jgi:UPF0755 protein
MKKRKRGPRSKRPPGEPKPPHAPKAPGPSGSSRAESLPWKVARWTLWIVGGLGLALFVGLVIVFPGGHGPGTGRDVELVVPGDESAEVLARRLEAAGLTDSPRLFAAYIRFSGGAGRVVPGTHLLTDDLSPRDVLARLERSSGAGRVKVTIPEGWTRFDIARRLQALHVSALRPFLDATASPALLAELHVQGDTAEGFLFPATYDLAPDSDPSDVVRRMKGEFDRRWTTLEGKSQAGILDLDRTLGWGQRQIVTLASMVEKEAVADDERPLIASVFLNRLRDPSFTPKILQCDPTAGYGCLATPERAPSCAGYAGRITHDIVADAQNPYNTYKHEGLPPGPIANPGAKSLDAVLNPATTRYLYFVARGDGRSTFSETYGAHTAAVHGTSRAP